MLSIIVAVANNNVIGKENKLIWHLPEDLKRFKNLTTGKNIIMGRKTFESLGRILPNRKHIILSNNDNFVVENEQVKVINNIEELKEYINSEDENFVIGGAMIYNLLMPYVNKMYITKICEDFNGDVYFPDIKESEWIITEKEQGLKNEQNPFNYEYITYIRR